MNEMLLNCILLCLIQLNVIPMSVTLLNVMLLNGVSPCLILPRDIVSSDNLLNVFAPVAFQVWLNSFEEIDKKATFDKLLSR
jgi:hypothetical protein